MLVTHYNRSKSLERLLKTFKEQNCSFEAIVVSDDGSAAEHQQALEELKTTYGFQLITTPVNKGLGNNINKGQDAVKTPYTLYVQEDFVPTPQFAAHLPDAVGFMREENDLDIVRFYAYRAYPYLEPYKKGFSRMVVKPWFTNYKKVYYYSDHPHLRRSSFLTKFGRYVEGEKVDKTEYAMCVSFIKHRGKGLFYNDFQGLFVQKNSSNEPSTWQYKSWRQSKNPLVTYARDIYRQVKYNYDMYLS
nr:glycosyltransferase [Pontibacter silvestris]